MTRRAVRAAGPGKPLIAGERGVEVIDFLGHDHLQLVNLGPVGIPALVFLAVEDLLAVQEYLKPARSLGGHLDGHVSGVLGGPQLGRQPRGDRVVASRHAVDDIDFNFTEFRRWHITPSGQPAPDLLHAGRHVWHPSLDGNNGDQGKCNESGWRLQPGQTLRGFQNSKPWTTLRKRGVKEGLGGLEKVSSLAVSENDLYR